MLHNLFFVFGNILVSVCLCSTTPTPIQVSYDTNYVQLKYLHIYSNIHYRYTRTRLLMQIINNATNSTTTSFYVKIPKDEFVTEFTIGGTRGKPEIMDNARQAYLNGSSNWLGVVELVTSAKKRYDKFDTYKIALNLIGGNKLNVTFSYEGLVHKVSGNSMLLQYELNIKPQQAIPVKSYQVKVNITEPRTSWPWISNIRGKRDPSKVFVVDQHSFQNGPNNWEVTWNPNDNQTAELISEQVFGEVKLIFPPSEDELGNVIMVRDGYLAYEDDVHVDMGESMEKIDLEIQPRHVVFVLDVSGSMEGRRLEQLKLGITKILLLMESAYSRQMNFVDIVAFSNTFTVWSPLGTLEAPHPLAGQFKTLALSFIQNLTVSGSTNVFAAVAEGLRLARRAKNFNPEVRSIIFFVTDGEPTSGLIDPKLITTRLRLLNSNGTVPIYSLAFGSEADFELCRNISSDTKGGLARKIFDLDTDDAAGSFEKFYRQIVSPALQNATFEYTTPVHYVKEVTHTEVVSVMVRNGSDDTMSQFRAIKFDETTSEIPCAEHCLMKRIFALRRIKKLYKMSHNETLVSGYCRRAEEQRLRSRPLTEIQEANKIAVLHKFVTPCTSLLIQT